MALAAPAYSKSLFQGSSQGDIVQHRCGAQGGGSIASQMRHGCRRRQDGVQLECRDISNGLACGRSGIRNVALQIAAEYDFQSTIHEIVCMYSSGIVRMQLRGTGACAGKTSSKVRGARGTTVLLEL